MIDESVCSRDGVLGPSILTVGVLENSGANVEGSIVLGGVCAVFANDQFVLLASGIED